jgi:hypothetical protein
VINENVSHCSIRGYYPHRVGINGFHGSMLEDVFSGYSKEISYLNRTDYDVTIVERSGVAVKIRSQSRSKDGTFIVRTKIAVSAFHADDFIRGLGEFRKSGNPELIAIADFVITNKMHATGSINLFLEYEIKQDELLQTDKTTVYLIPCDLLVSLRTDTYALEHPFSSVALRNKDLVVSDGESAHASEHFSFVKVEIIDNTERIGPRYVNMLGTVDKIIPLKDFTRRDGVYLYRREQKIQPRPIWYISKTVMTLEEAKEKLGLMESHEEALSAGDVKTRLKLDLTRLESELSQGKHEIAKMSLEQSRVTALNEQLTADNRRINELLRSREDVIKHTMNMESMTTKHSTDMTSMRRKDYSELIKTLPSLITAVLTLIVLIKQGTKK